MTLLIQHPTNQTDAFERAARRGVLPSALSSTEQRGALSQLIREMSVFSARTTNAKYLQVLREVINQIAQGDMDMAEARVTLRATLTALGYTPEGGFPDDETPVPPAVEGSLQDLRSFRRLDLILRTQLELLHGAGQKMRGEEPAALRSFPAWELVRVHDRRAPRDWAERFRVAYDHLGIDIEDTMFGKTGRLIAMKGDPLWAALGNSELFDDALDVDHSPFAFNSGRRLRAVPRDELESLGVDSFVIDGEELTLDDVLAAIPRPKVSTSGMDDDFIDQLKDDLDTRTDSKGRLSMAEILRGALERSGQL